MRTRFVVSSIQLRPAACSVDASQRNGRASRIGSGSRRVRGSTTRIVSPALEARTGR